MPHPIRAAVAALLVAAPLAGCTASTTDGAGTTLASGAATAPAPSGSASSGSASSAPTGSAKTLDPLTGEHTALALDPQFLNALTTLQVTPALVGRATLQASTVQFPITGGRLVAAGPSVTGQVEHRGSGLSLKAGAVTISLTDLTIFETNHVVTSTVLVDASTALSAAPVLDLDQTARRSTSTGGVVTVAGETVSLSQEGATLLDSVFKTTALLPGLRVGTLTITATG